MIEKLLYLEFLNRKSKNRNSINSNIKLLLIPITILITSNYICKSIGENIYFLMNINIMVTLTFILQIILRNTIKELRKNPILIFIKKERYIFIKRTIELKILKVIVLLVVPALLPLIIYARNKITVLGICLLIIINFYLMNLMIVYLIRYLEKVSRKNICIKIIYISSLIAFSLIIFKLHISVINKIMEYLIQKKDTILNLHSNKSIIILTLMGLVNLIVYEYILNFLRYNLYLILETVGDNSYFKSNLWHNMLGLKSKSLYTKILIKDILCFMRKKGLDFYMVLIMQLGIFCFYCFTILKDRPKGINEKIESIAMIYLICLFFNFILVKVSIFSNLKEIVIEEEYNLLKKFNIKVDKLKILIEKSNFIFVISSVSTILMIFINILLDISFVGLFQNFIITLLLLSWIRYCSLLAIDSRNFGVNSIKVLFFGGIVFLNIKMVFNIFEFNNNLIPKYLLVVLINILAYYIEFLLIKFLGKEHRND